MYTVQTQPLPRHTTAAITNKRRVYPFYELRPGKMFRFPSKKAVAVRGSLNNHNKLRKAKGQKTITCTILRINRTEHGCWCLGYNGNQNPKVLKDLGITGGTING